MDWIKSLAEASVDTLFLLIGFGFLALAVVGSISGKVNMGKGGRIAAGILGPVLILTGLWMHQNDHAFKILSADLSSPQDGYEGPCPAEVPIQAVVTARGAGAVAFVYELDGATISLVQSLEFSSGTAKVHNGTGRVKKTAPRGVLRLKTIAPAGFAVERPFQVNCQGGAELKAATPPPVPAPAPEPASTSASATTAAPPPSAPPSTPTPSPASTVAKDRSPMVIKRPDLILATRVEHLAIDSVHILAVSPDPSARLPRGRPVSLNVDLRYNLVSADSAILALSVAQFEGAPSKCAASSGELTDAAEIPIRRGTHEARVTVTWSGDTGASTKGRVQGKGFIGFAPSFWSGGTQRGNRIRYFGVDPNYCLAF